MTKGKLNDIPSETIQQGNYINQFGEYHDWFMQRQVAEPVSPTKDNPSKPKEEK